MTRVTITRIALAASLTLAVGALGAMVWREEAKLADAQIVRVKIEGYDPRDMLRGHYLVFRIAWQWQEPAERSSGAFLCVLPGDDLKAEAKVRMIAERPAEADKACRAIIRGRLGPNQGGARAFLPDGLSPARLYIPEGREAELTALLQGAEKRLAVDLAVTSDGYAHIKDWYIDGKSAAEFFGRR